MAVPFRRLDLLVAKEEQADLRKSIALKRDDEPLTDQERMVVTVKTDFIMNVLIQRFDNADEVAKCNFGQHLDLPQIIDVDTLKAYRSEKQFLLHLKDYVCQNRNAFNKRTEDTPQHRWVSVEHGYAANRANLVLSLNAAIAVVTKRMIRIQRDICEHTSFFTLCTMAINMLLDWLDQLIREEKLQPLLDQTAGFTKAPDGADEDDM